MGVMYVPYFCAWFQFWNRQQSFWDLAYCLDSKVVGWQVKHFLEQRYKLWLAGHSQVENALWNSNLQTESGQADSRRGKSAMWRYCPSRLDTISHDKVLAHGRAPSGTLTCWILGEGEPSRGGHRLETEPLEAGRVDHCWRLPEKEERPNKWGTRSMGDERSSKTPDRLGCWKLGTGARNMAGKLPLCAPSAKAGVMREDFWQQNIKVPKKSGV